MCEKEYSQSKYATFRSKWIVRFMSPDNTYYCTSTCIFFVFFNNEHNRAGVLNAHSIFFFVKHKICLNLKNKLYFIKIQIRILLDNIETIQIST